MIECWVNGDYFDSMALAAAYIKVSASILSRGRESGIITIHHNGQVFEVTFYPPPQVAPAPQPAPPHHPGDPLLASNHCILRFGVYRGERF